MTVKIGLNGFGRIGRLALRRIDELDSKDIEVSAINDLTTPAMLAYLLKHDSMHGKFNGTVSATDDAIIVNGKRIPVYAERDAKDIPWVKNDDVELVLECTGFYTSKEKAQAHLDAGAKRVLISAPAGDITTIVPGVNMDTLRPDDHIVSAGSCTTNCLAPVAYWLNKDFGVKVGTMTTVHAYTASQAIQDGPRSPKLQDDRAAAVNTVPHSSGAAKAIGLVIPELDGALKGHAQRVAVADGSLTELVSVLDKKVTADEVNKALVGHANDAFGYTDDYMVSTDVLDDPHGSVFDPGQTEITEANGVQLVKTVAWYDNEWGFTCNMVRTLQEFAKFL